MSETVCKLTTPQGMTLAISAVLLVWSTNLFNALTSHIVALLSLREARDTPAHRSGRDASVFSDFCARQWRFAVFVPPDPRPYDRGPESTLHGSPLCGCHPWERSDNNTRRCQSGPSNDECAQGVSARLEAIRLEMR